MVIAFKDTFLGKIGIAEENGAVTHLCFTDCEKWPASAKEGMSPLLAEAFRQLDAYFSKKITTFSLPLAPVGTPFQMRVWNVLETIPYGEAWSYKDVATRAGNPKATRAVGMANNRNPIAIIIPCHRVIGADGTLVGYGGGLDRKVKLLALEGYKMLDADMKKYG